METILPPKEPIVEDCKGCNKIIIENEQEVCKIFLYPVVKWKLSKCPMGSHVVREIVKEKQRVGQQKQKIKHR